MKLVSAATLLCVLAVVSACSGAAGESTAPAQGIGASPVATSTPEPTLPPSPVAAATSVSTPAVRPADTATPRPAATPVLLPTPTGIPTAAAIPSAPPPTLAPSATRAATPTIVPPPAASSTPTPSPIPAATPTRTPPTLECKPHSFPQRTQRSLAVDPTNDKIVYIGIEQEGYFKSVDGGETWLRIVDGIKSWDRTGHSAKCYEEFYETVIDASNPQRLCFSMAGSPGTVATFSSASNNGVYCSTDGGTHWEQRVTPTMNLAVYTLAADPRDFNVMYAGVNGGSCSNPPPVCEPNTYYNSRGAVYKTTDGGRTWTELDSLYVTDQRVVAVRLDQAAPDTVMAATFGKVTAQGSAPGSFADAAQSGVLRSADGGKTWSKSTSGMNASPSEQALLFMEVSNRNANNLYVTASSNAGYWSADGGVTFTKSARMTSFNYDPHDPTGLHMIGCKGAMIQESFDGGKTWTDVSPTPGYISETAGLPTDFEWSRQDQKTIYISGAYASLYRSLDGGKTWAKVLSAEKLPK